MATPSLPNINAFDVNTGITITYQANNGYDTITKSVVYILDAAGTEIGHHTYSNSSSTTHVITPKTGTGWTWNTDGGKSANDFTDNKQYQMYITWFDNASTPQESDRSNYIGFWTLPNPTIELQTPASPYQILVTTYTVTAEYSANNPIINNAPNATQFYLYRVTSTTPTIQVELEDVSPVLYTSGTLGSDGKYQIKYEFTNLNNRTVSGYEEGYCVAVKTISLQGMEAVNGFSYDKRIIPNIGISELNVLTGTTNDCEGCVNLVCNISDITGIYDDDPTVTPTIPTTGLDLTGNHKLVFDDGLKFTDSWNFSFWGNDFDLASYTGIGSTEQILHLSNLETLENGVIDIFMVQDPSDNTKIKAIMIVYPLGYNGGVSSYFESNSVTEPVIANNEYTCIQVQYKDFYYYINLTNVTVAPYTPE